MKWEILKAMLDDAVYRSNLMYVPPVAFYLSPEAMVTYWEHFGGEKQAPRSYANYPIRMNHDEQFCRKHVAMENSG